MNSISAKEIKTAAVCLIIYATILVWDYFTPLGVADGMLYSIPIFFALFVGSIKLVLATIVLGILLTMIGFFISPPLGILWIVILNRALSVFTILAIGILVMMFLFAQRGRETAERAVSDLNKRLLESNRELEMFAHTISHDLKTPLHSIQGLITVIEEDYGQKLDQEARELLQRVISSVDTMKQMIGAILNISKLSRTHIKKIENTDLSAIARSVVETLCFSMPDREVRVAIQDDIHVSCDPVLMRIVLQNLLGNAWKFTMKTQNPFIEFHCAEENGIRVFYVQDNGAGFNDAHKDRLFQLFARLHSKNEFEGTGTGLATIKKIIEVHGGKVWATGTLGKGARFMFTLGECPEEKNKTSRHM